MIHGDHRDGDRVPVAELDRDRAPLLGLEFRSVLGNALCAQRGPARLRRNAVSRCADSVVGVPETTDRDLQYHVLPDDPLAALNVLRQAAGLEPLPSVTSTEESGYCPQRRSRVTSRTATASALYPAHMHWYGSWKTAAMCMGLFDERQRARQE